MVFMGAWLELNKKFWQVAESFEKTTRIPFFSKFVTPLEMIGVPSLLVLLAVVFGFFGALFFALQPAAPSSGYYTIRVLSAQGEPLNVAVTLAGEGGTQTVQAVNGEACFSLSPGRYELFVTGGLEPSSNVVYVRPGGVQVISLQARGEAAGVFLLVEDSLGLPVPSANVEYRFGESVRQSRANASGYAPLFVVNESVNASVSAPGFEEAHAYFAAVPGYVHVVSLLRVVDAPASFNLLSIQRQEVSSPNQQVRTGTIEVNVAHLSDTGFAPVGNAFVGIYNSFSNTLVAEGRTNVRGVAALRNVPVANDVNLYAVIEAEGFVTKQTQVFAFAGEAKLNETLVRASANNSRELLVTLQGDEPRRGDVFILSSQGALLATRLNANNQVVVRNLPREPLYVAVTSQSHVRFASSLIGVEQQQVSVSLKQANASNSGVLRVNVTDFQARPVPLASVALSIGNVFSPSVGRSNAAGEVVFANVPLGLVTITGEKNSFVARESFTLQGNVNKTIVLRPPTGTVGFSVVDYVTNQPLFANLTVYFQPAPGQLVEVPSDCRLSEESTSCTLSIMSGIRFLASASLTGYHSSSVEFEAQPSQHGEVQIKLFPEGFTQQAEFLGIFENERKLRQSEALVVGKIYAARFAVKTNRGTSANRYGLFVKMGDAAESFSSGSQRAGIAFISPDYSSGGSIFYSQFVNASDNPSCGSRLEQQGLGLYKWVLGEAEAQTAPSDYVELAIPLAPVSQGSTSLRFFSIASFGNGERIERFPSDAVLGNVFSTPSKQWCDAETRSIDLRVEKRDEVKCNKHACIKAWFKQGETVSFSSFTARSTQETGQNLFLDFEVTDFLQSPTELSFSAPPALQLDAGQSQPQSGVSADEFRHTFTGLRSTGSISASVAPQRASHAMRVVFGTKIATELNLDVLAPPPPPLDLDYLGNTYEVWYDEQSDELKLLNEEGEEVEFIDMRTDALLPADAVFLYLNYSSSHCEAGQNFLHVLNEETGCFEIVDAPPDLVDPAPGLKMVKFDATKPQCTAFSQNLNVVKTASTNLTVQNACTPARMDVNISVRNGVIDAGDSLLYAGLLGHVVFTEPIDDLGSENPFDEVPRSLWALAVNRQYSHSGAVTIAASDILYASDEGGIVSHEPGKTYAKSTRRDGVDFNQEFGIEQPPYLSELFTAGIKDKQVNMGRLAGIRDVVNTIAQNTVFRRRPRDCIGNPSCKLKAFPFSVFSNKDFSYQLGAGYLGTNREHRVNLEGFEAAGRDDEGRAMQGVYALSLAYKRGEEGTYSWTPIAAPLSIASSDYYDGSCGAETLLLGNALSWRGTTCLQACGDGMYFDLKTGDGGPLCDGSFRVSRFWDYKFPLKTIQLASELTACISAGCGAVYACAAGWQASCTATSSNPATAVASAGTCTPKGLICGQTTGLAAGFAAAQGVNALLAEPSGCDVVGDLASAGIGGGLAYATLFAYPPTEAASSVCRSIFGFGPVGSDAEAASQLVTAECVGMIGAKYASLISSWINHGFVDAGALSPRAYVDIMGQSGLKACTSWQSNIGRYFVYQDCEFKSIWARQGEKETCSASPNVKLYTKELSVRRVGGLAEYDGAITFKIKS